MDENLELQQKHPLQIEREEEEIKRRKLMSSFSDLTDEQLVAIFGEGLRFELCRIYLFHDHVVGDFQLFGTIQAAASAGGFSSDPLLQQNRSFDIFNREFNNPICYSVCGSEILDDVSHCSLRVSSSSVLQIAAKLYVSTDKVEDIVEYPDDYDRKIIKLEPDDISPEEIEEIEEMRSLWSEISLEPASTVEKNEISSEPTSSVEKNEISLEPASTVEKKQNVMEYIIDRKANEVLHVCNDHAFINISDKPNGGAACLEGNHGSLELFYVVFKYAVDAEVEVEFSTTTAAHTKVSGLVTAYYGNGFDYPDPDHFYYARLFDSLYSYGTPGRINLIRSVLAVPAKSSLIIEANLKNTTSKAVVGKISGKHEFFVPCDCRSSIGTIQGDGCSLKLKVNWKLPSEERKICSSLNLSVSSCLTERRKFGAHSTSTMAGPDECIRWSLEEEIAKVFNTSLKRTFKLQKDVPCSISTCTKEDGGDYLCSSVMHIWPEIKNTGAYKGPKRAGVAVKDDIMGSDYRDMMERCVVCGPGFVKFKLCRKWIAESIRTMLTVGIQTWAPKLSVKKVIIYFWSQNLGEELHMGHLRSTFIGETLARMLEYSGVVVLQKRIHDGDSMDEFIQKRYQTVYQHMGINLKEEYKSIYEPYTREIQDLLGEKGLRIGSEGDELPLVDLTVLWHALNEEKADWIIHVTDVWKRVYIEMCITAARRAGLIPNDHSKCPISHVGFGLDEGDDFERFQVSSTKVDNLVSLFDEAKSRCKELLEKHAGAWTAHELERAAEALGYGAVKYADLKNNRLTDYTFSFDQMFNKEGNTAVYLHFTHVRICSIIMNSSKDIKELKGEVLILKQDDERELGLHLLRFTEVLGEVCTILAPHILCDYLYGLCKKFNSLDSSAWQVVGSSEETSKLLLCKATEVVMRKCFDLLGITCYL